MRRVFLIVLDSLGVGALPDAAAFGDQGAHTLDHLVEAAGGLDAPRLVALGLGCVPGVTRLPRPASPGGAFGRAAELSPTESEIIEHLGDAYWRAGRTVEAKFTWKAALRLKPDPVNEAELRTKLDRGLPILPGASLASRP